MKLLLSMMVRHVPAYKPMREHGQKQALIKERNVKLVELIN